MHALLRGHAHELLPERPHRTGVGGEVAGDKVDQRGLARPVRPDDQPPLARHDAERDVLRRGQAAEALAQMRDFERGRRHCASSEAAPPVALRALMRFCNRRHACVQPGTRPYGMNMITTTKITPSSVFQRSTYVETTFFTSVMIAAPPIGPGSMLAPPRIAISRISQEWCSESRCGLRTRL